LPTTWIEDTDIDKNTNRFKTQTGTTYDDAGQVTTDNKFRNLGFAYDANGRQIKATRTNTPDAQTVYDALGNRVATKINDIWQYMIYDAFGQLVAEYGIQPEGLGGVKYIQQDHQGSVRTVTNSNGFVVARTDHQAFGDEVGIGVGLRSIEQGYSVDKVAKQGYGLTENDDATGQQHTWFRKLETQAGRWSSPDPYKGSMSLGNPQSFNRYSYVENQPTNYVDPSGLTMVLCVRYGDDESGWSPWDCETIYENVGWPGENRTRDPWIHPPGTGGGGGGGVPPKKEEEKTIDCRPSLVARVLGMNGTRQIGVHGTGILGVIAGTMGTGVAIDELGNFSIYGESGGGVGAGGDISGGLNVMNTTAPNIRDLEGPFGNSSIGAGEGVHVAVLANAGVTRGGDPIVGFGLNVGPGAGAGYSGTVTATKLLTEPKNIWQMLDPKGRPCKQQ
jgi:RHS repeat-associated protein